MVFTVRVEHVTKPVVVFVWRAPLRVRVDAVKLVGLIRFRVDTVTVELTIIVLKKEVNVCWVEKLNVEIKSEPPPVKVDAVLI